MEVKSDAVWDGFYGSTRRFHELGVFIECSSNEVFILTVCDAILAAIAVENSPGT